MNYQKIYNQIIHRRQQEVITEGYSEKHHIVPRSLGGSDDKENLVKLTAREHFICHYLLVKIYEERTSNWYKMVKAFNMMKTTSNNQERYFNSRLYEALKYAFSETQSFCQSGEKNSQHGTTWINNLKLRKIKKVSLNKLQIELDNGWKKGRCLSNKEFTKERKHGFRLYMIRKLFKKIKKRKIRQAKKEKQILKLTNWYNIYKEVGFNEFVKITGYSYSKPNLVMAFERHVVEFKPQNGKQRKIGV